MGCSKFQHKFLTTGIPQIPPKRQPQIKHPFSEITSRFDKDLYAPPFPTKEIAAKIKTLKQKFIPVLRQIKNTKIKHNVTKMELEALENLKNKENIGIHLTDKKNRIAIVPETLVDNKTFDHLDSTKFEKVDGDPSKAIESKAKALLDNIFEDPDIEIPPYIYKHLYPQNTNAPHSQ